MSFSIAIDGPAGAGKSTIAKMIADNIGFMYINTGAMYRAVTYFALKNNIQPTDSDKLITLINKLDFKFQAEKLLINNVDISGELTSPNISQKVAAYAAVVEIRELLTTIQRELSHKYNVVMDGRDIGTHVLKDAKYKFFLTASAEKRAERRYNELVESGLNVNYDTILEDIIKRDYADTTRELNPLVQGDDAILIDSSEMNISEVVQFISSFIE